MTRLHDLFDAGGQSPWIDNLQRSYIETGELAEFIASGIRGMTSNPTIMSNAIEAGNDYDEQFADLITSGTSIEDSYWEMVLHDVNGALSAFEPVFQDSNGGDGFVSVEVSPTLAHDTEGTVHSALELHHRVNRPNLLVKIPATLAGIPAIEETIAAGHSVNVTLIFSLERYDAVINAYLSGLERLHAAGGDLHAISSVASFFVSRVDTEVDRRLDAIAAEESSSTRGQRALDLRGKAALAQARLAYALFEQRFSSERAKTLLDDGARKQRPLWASTSTKNPSYPDLLYVEGLIGPDTVNTMPPVTIKQFQDHGVIARTVDADVDEAREVLSSLAEVGVSLDDVTAQLESEGVTAFAKSFSELHETLDQHAVALGAHRDAK